MTINNPQTFVSQLWDWGVLNGCFGQSNIKPTDVDGLVEHRGHFLMLEAKNNGVPIPKGQSILHDAWLAQRNSLIVVYGEPGNPSKLEYYPFGRKTAHVAEPANIETLRKAVSHWYRKAHDKPK